MLDESLGLNNDEALTKMNWLKGWHDGAELLFRKAGQEPILHGGSISDGHWT